MLAIPVLERYIGSAAGLVFPSVVPSSLPASGFPLGHSATTADWPARPFAPSYTTQDQIQ
jgi:hypothetical protein